MQKSFDLGGTPNQWIPATVLTDAAGNALGGSTSPLQVTNADYLASGNITLVNANGNAGAGTAGSYVAYLNLNDAASVSIQVTGTFVGTLQIQAQINGTNWVSMGATSLINITTNAYAANIAQTGIWQADIAGFTAFRLVATAWTSGTANVAMHATQANGVVALDQPLPTGTNNVGQISLSPTALGGGTSNAHLVAAASTNATLVKAATGRVYSVYAINNTASAKYIKLYNKATAPVPGTDAPVRVFQVPANTIAPLNWSSSSGMSFAAGIGYAVTGAITDLDATAVAAGDVVLDIEYL